MERKKNKTGKILLMLITMLAVLWAGVLTANADSKTVSCSKADMQTLVTFPASYKSTKNNDLKIQNTSGMRLKLSITEKLMFTKIYSDDDKAQALICGTYSSWVESAGAEIYLEAGESITLWLDFSSSYNGQSEIKISTTRAMSADNGGRTFQTAKAIPIEGTVTGELGAYKLNNQSARYFKFTTAKKHYLTLDLTGQSSKQVTLWLYNANDSSMTNSLTGSAMYSASSVTMRKNLFLQPGTYVIKVAHTSAGDGSFAVFNLKMSGRDYIPATGVKLTCSSDNRILDAGIKNKAKTLTFTATTIPSNSDDKLKDIKVTGPSARLSVTQEGSVSGENSGRFTVSFGGGGLYSGTYRQIQVTTTNGCASPKMEVATRAEKPSVGKNYVSHYNMIWFNGNFCSTSEPVQVYMKSGSKWVLKTTRKNSQPFAIRKLKANKKYQFRFVKRSRRADGSWLNGSAATMTIRTASGSKAQISSVSVSNVKVSSEYKWVNTGNTSQLRKKYYTTCKVTVNLKKKIPGALGLEIDGTKVKGKGTKFTITMRLYGDYRGRSYDFKIRPYSQKNSTGGYGPAVTKKIRIK